MTAGPEGPERERPKIDLSAAIGEGGHEVEELGYEGVPDDGPLVTHGSEPGDADAEVDRIVLEAPPD